MGADSKLKSTSGWKNDAKGLAFASLALAKSPKALSNLNENSNGTDDYSFTALPAGDRNAFYNFEGFYAEFWSSTEANSEYSNKPHAYKMLLTCPIKATVLGRGYKEFGFSVRCVKD